ncbi:MAG: CocE/NonD family hydrolase [Myxococcota bacterium]
MSDVGRNQFAIMSPTAHCEFSRFDDASLEDDGPSCAGEMDFHRIYLAFFDHWLRDGPDPHLPALQLFVMGANQWRWAERWPLKDTVMTAWYLHSEGAANGRLGDGRLALKAPSVSGMDRFTYDPKSPVPSVGGAACCTGTPDAPAGRYDQREVELRDDVLVYTGPVLDAPVEVIGPLVLELFVSSDAPDTDFTAKLVDVYPDGRAINIQEGIVRARTQVDGALNAKGVTRLSLDLQATANRFRVGHRIRLEVSSSNFPRWDRNLNTGGNNYDETEFRSAQNRVHHSPEHPSRLLLPTVAPGAECASN